MTALTPEQRDAIRERWAHLKPDEEYIGHLQDIPALLADNDRLRTENSALAAYQCNSKSGDEHGNPICLRAEAAERERDRYKAVVEAARTVLNYYDDLVVTRVHADKLKIMVWWRLRDVLDTLDTRDG